MQELRNANVLMLNNVSLLEALVICKEDADCTMDGLMAEAQRYEGGMLLKGSPPPVKVPAGGFTQLACSKEAECEGENQAKWGQWQPPRQSTECSAPMFVKA